jgi:hypothetical protein
MLNNTYIDSFNPLPAKLISRKMCLNDSGLLNPSMHSTINSQNIVIIIQRQTR